MGDDPPTCDEVFGQYLTEVAEKVTTQGFGMFVDFIQALRTCLNQRGWELSGQTSSTESGIYSEVQTATNLPEISNYFITDFLEDEEVDLDREKAISMMLHFDEFLFTHRYSNLKLSLLGNE